MQNQNFKINAMQAEFCSAVGDANRVMIIYELANGPRNVKNLAKTIGLSPSTTSRHLKVLRDKNFVSSHRKGHSVIYSLAAPKLFEALDIFLDILNNQLTHRANLVQMERYK